MMTALGVLEAIRPADHAASDPINPARPGDEAAPLLEKTAETRGGSSEQSLLHARRADAERSRDRAMRRVEVSRNSTTLAALAQTQAALGDFGAAVDAAREALDLSLYPIREGSQVLDPPSARIAAEVLLRCGEGEYAYDALRRRPLPKSLVVTFARLASSLGNTAEAEAALGDYEGAAVAGFRGYLRAASGRWQDAVRDLRGAVSEEPDDADSLLNLSISLWHLGSVQKATRAALRATRTAPFRKDISLHFLGLLLEQGQIARANSEMVQLLASGVVPDAKFLEMQGRVALAAGNKSRAIRLLGDAAAAAKRECDQSTEGAVLGNLVILRYELGRMDRELASRRLTELMSAFPDNDAIVVRFAQIARTHREAAVLRAAYARVAGHTTQIRHAYLRHQLAVLKGDVDAAGAAAEEWFELEPKNPMAAVTAMVAVGIGQGRWGEAVAIVEYALKNFPQDATLLNNSAYVLAMGGYADKAIEILAGTTGADFVLNATLGLAYLAKGNFDKGMRLYREAADAAEQADPAMRSLMTAYQALVVRQLGIDAAIPTERIAAMALAPFDLPSDWKDRPDFLRIHSICVRYGYQWPLRL